MSPSLSLFPSPSTSVARKSSSRRARADDTDDLHLRGVAFQVVTSPRKTAQVQPAADTIKHSLFCDTQSSTNVPTPTGPGSREVVDSTQSSSRSSLLRRQSRTRRKSGPMTMDLPAFETPYTKGENDEPGCLAELPQDTRHLSSIAPRGGLSKPSRPPQNLSTIVQPDSINLPMTPRDEKQDHRSSSPTKTDFTLSKMASDLEHPSTWYSGSPASSETPKSPEHYYAIPMRSMFPTYDPSKPLDRQDYYPSPSASPPSAHLGDHVSKIGSPTERQDQKRFDSAVGLLDGYDEHVPVAAHGDMQALWKASCEDFPVAGQKVQFGLFQPAGHGKTLAIGTSSEDLIYAMEGDAGAVQPKGEPPSKQFAVRKHCPTARSSLQVSTLVLPDPAAHGKAATRSTKEVTTIFPHAAALHAIEAILSTSDTANTTTFDPTAQSSEVAALAQSAVAAAHRRYRCDLIKRTRKRDSLGSVTAHYDLVHPMLGTCPVTVTKSLAARSTSGPRAKISFHHPTATPAAVAADTLNLAFIDFAHDACVLDIPGLLALDSHYVLDTVVSTLLAVAVIENDALVAEALVFDAPPKTPVRSGKSSKRQQKKMKRRSSVGSSTPFFRRSGTRKAKAKEEKEADAVWAVDEQVELGGVAKGVLAVMELTFQASAWVLITGAKVGFGVVGYGVQKIQKRIG